MMAEENQERRTPLHLAAENGHHETVSALLTAGADVNARDRESHTPLHKAAQNGHHETVSALLAAGADVNAQGSWRRTPLHLAALKDHHETVSALLRAGADVKALDRWARTPLHEAVKKGHHKTSSTLLTADADVNAQDWDDHVPLHLAAENGHHKTVLALLTGGADANTQDQVNRTPLHLAAQNGHHETVSSLLTAGADVKAQDRLRSTPLHLAALNGHHETVSALLTAGADVNAQDNQRGTPLHLAAENGHHETVSALLTAGADVNAQDNQRSTPLNLAAWHHETVSALLTAGANVNALHKRRFSTPLHLAAAKGHHETVSALLRAGADVTIQDEESQTPLHLAAKKGHHQTVSALLAAGANVDAQASLKRTPLHLAAEKGHHETVSALLTASADKNAWDSLRLRTPLHLATEKGHHETVSALLTAGADVDTRDREGRTPLHLAVQNGPHETVSALLTAGVAVNTQDEESQTPLHLAAKKGHHQTVSALLTCGANVDARASMSRTPLHLAAEKGHHETLSALLTASADVNAQDSQSRTPLHLAAENGHHETVSALLTAGAYKNARDWKRTPLHLAAENGHHETVSVLLTAGANVNTWDRRDRTPLHLAAENGHPETVSALLTAGAGVNTRDSHNRSPLQEAQERGHHECVKILLLHGAHEVDRTKTLASKSKEHKGTLSASGSGSYSKSKEHKGTLSASGLDSYSESKEHKGTLSASGLDSYIRSEDQSKGILLGSSSDSESEEQSILGLYGKLRQQEQGTEQREALFASGLDSYSKGKGKKRPSADDLGSYSKSKGKGEKRPFIDAPTASYSKLSVDFQQMLRTIFNRLDDTDVHLLLQVWSAREARQKSPGIKTPNDLMQAMLKSGYITTGVPEQLKYTKTAEASVGPLGGELEISGCVKLIVPPNVLHHPTTITISTVDLPNILRDPDGVHWTSGYPWSLDEATCPRELLDQVLFSPAVDVNLHGARLNGAVEIQTRRPPGSKGMGCVLLKHHDGEGWTDITASTVHQIYPDKISVFLQTFSPLDVLWAPVDLIITVGKMVADALSSRTLNCRFSAYNKPSMEDVQFHVVCRDQGVETNEYLPGFTMCGSNAAMFDLYHGDKINVAVNVRGGQEKSKQMDLRAQHCKNRNGQNVQMLLDRPNGKRVKGEVTVKRIQQQSYQTVCQLIFKEESDILPSVDVMMESLSVQSSSSMVPEKKGSASQQRDDGAGPSGVRSGSCAEVDVQDYFDEVIANVSHKWDDLARKLGFSRNEIDGIHTLKPDQDRRCREMLERWRNREASEATVQVLKQALVDIDERLTAESFKEL